MGEGRVGAGVGGGGSEGPAGFPVTQLGTRRFGDFKCRFFPSWGLCGHLGYFSDAV